MLHPAQQFAWRQARWLANAAHFGPERGCVVSTKRSTPAQNQAIHRIRALRLVFDTAARQNKLLVAKAPCPL
jgi:hypothetical protein